MICKHILQEILDVTFCCWCKYNDNSPRYNINLQRLIFLSRNEPMSLHQRSPSNRSTVSRPLTIMDEILTLAFAALTLQVSVSIACPNFLSLVYNYIT